MYALIYLTVYIKYIHNHALFCKINYLQGVNTYDIYPVI